MNLLRKLNSRFPEIALVLLIGVLIYYQALFFPFLLALACAYFIGDKLKSWQKIIKNWELRVSLFLIAAIASLLLFLAFTTNFIIHDFQRFSNSFKILVEENQSELDAGAQKVKDWVSAIYDPNEIEALVQEQLGSLDSLGEDQGSLKSLGEQLQKIPELFKSNTEEERESFQLPEINFWLQVASFLLYLVLILFHFPYFDQVRSRYKNPHLQSSWNLFWDDFNNSFVRYFKLRSRIVLWLLPLYAIGFLALNLPGTVIYIIALVILLYIPYFQYILLIPIALSSLVLSTEIALSYWWIMAIVLGLFIVANILEEAFLIPRIMERHIGLNPVIMVFGLSFWTYTLGTLGVIIGIPLTSLALIYLKRFILPRWFSAAADE